MWVRDIEDYYCMNMFKIYIFFSRKNLLRGVKRMNTNPTSWIYKSGENTFTFHIQNDQVSVSFSKDKNIIKKITEKNIIIEIENITALLQGMPQKTFHMNNLASPQKQNILHSLQGRNIEIIKDDDQYFLLIHALTF